MSESQPKRIVPKSEWKVIPTSNWLLQICLPGRSRPLGGTFVPALLGMQLRSRLLRLFKRRA